MKRIRTILSIFLLLGIGSGIYLWWRLSDEQVLLRQVDALCETVSVRTISLGDEDRPIEIFRSLIADPVTLSGSSAAPHGTYSKEEMAKELKRYRQAVKSATARRLETSVTLSNASSALVEALIEHEASWFHGSRTADRIRARLAFRKGPEGWILTEADFREASGK